MIQEQQNLQRYSQVERPLTADSPISTSPSLPSILATAHLSAETELEESRERTSSMTRSGTVQRFNSVSTHRLIWVCCNYQSTEQRTLGNTTQVRRRRIQVHQHDEDVFLSWWDHIHQMFPGRRPVFACRGTFSVRHNMNPPSEVLTISRKASSSDNCATTRLGYAAREPSKIR